MCIHVPAPKREECVHVHIAKVCIHVPGPEAKVSTDVQNTQKCVYTYYCFGTSLEYCVLVVRCSAHPHEAQATMTATDDDKSKRR